MNSARSIAVYSEADEVMPYLELADGAVCIGPAEPAKSYLNASGHFSVADLVQAGAIAPRYGFLAESPHFVEHPAKEHGVCFIGAVAATMIVGDKTLARRRCPQRRRPRAAGVERSPRA